MECNIEGSESEKYSVKKKHGLLHELAQKDIK